MLATEGTTSTSTSFLSRRPGSQPTHNVVDLSLTNRGSQRRVRGSHPCTSMSVERVLKDSRVLSAAGGACQRVARQAVQPSCNAGRGRDLGGTGTDTTIDVVVLPKARKRSSDASSSWIEGAWTLAMKQSSPVIR